MARYNRLALNVVMIFFGVMLIAGSSLSAVGTTLFPFDQYVGTRASVAGIAFGAGIALAGFEPTAHPMWVRLAVLYCILDVAYEIVAALALGAGAFSLVPFLMALIVGGLLVFLTPRRSELLPRPGNLRQGAQQA